MPKVYEALADVWTYTPCSEYLTDWLTLENITLGESNVSDTEKVELKSSINICNVKSRYKAKKATLQREFSGTNWEP